MKKLMAIKAKLSNGHNKEIVFGHPTTGPELRNMFKFRYDSYVKHDYIKKGYFKDGLDRDEYDKNKKSVYFIAKTDNKIIGAVRLIIDDPLPTEKDCFDFIEPKEMKGVSRSKRGEVSRLIVERYSEKIFFPRHMVMMGLLSCVVSYCVNNGLTGGYGFIKDKLKKKLEKIKIPIKFISKFKQKYSQDLLHNYFNNPSDPVWPIYYRVKDMDAYLNLAFKHLFKKLEDNTYEYRGANFLKKLSFLAELNRSKHRI